LMALAVIAGALIMIAMGWLPLGGPLIAGMVTGLLTLRDTVRSGIAGAIAAVIAIAVYKVGIIPVAFASVLTPGETVLPGPEGVEYVASLFTILFATVGGALGGAIRESM